MNQIPTPAIVGEFRKDIENLQHVLHDNSFLELKDSLDILDESLKKLDSPLQIMIMGAFSTGKSSFINALLGEEITAVGALPTTAIITKLSYGNDENVAIQFADGSTKTYATTEFVKISTENTSSWKNLREKIRLTAQDLNRLRIFTQKQHVNL